ncbi:hypothetical protein E2C01_007670 [Portunus trituberculatus]|uniref:Uncharacterized protein n=1 Tax=Portunus trituberculatus TaxID=210409 RepID=A0A5B7CYS8_PORTR|nr:hypothetical protein [Portunus trituberculatus]
MSAFPQCSLPLTRPPSTITIATTTTTLSSSSSSMADLVHMHRRDHWPTTRHGRLENSQIGFLSGLLLPLTDFYIYSYRTHPLR